MRITVVVEKYGLALEAGLSKLTRQIQKKDKLGYHIACARAEKEFDKTDYTQVIHTESKDVNVYELAEHIAYGAPFYIQKS